MIAAPTRYAVDLDGVKEHLRILHNDEDLLLTGFIGTASEYFSWLTGVTVYLTTWELALDCFPSKVIALPCASPLVAVVSIKYIDSDGVETTLAPAKYAVDTAYGRVSPAYGESWPSFTPYPLSAVRIRYTAGRATNTEPPPGARECIAEIVGGLYENRESTLTTDRSTVAAFAENPITKRLLAQFKRNYAF